MVDRLLKSFAALFEVRYPQTVLDRKSALMLAIIVIAGALVRFWGLGSVGLHGDEKTMALPAMHLLEHGTPLMPSGMFYARAVGQLYLMAAAVLAFGQTEWALRLPSALCGVLLIPLAWTSGRRFLQPAWNLALTAAVAFLPDFIEDAQTARMYVFLVASVAAFMTLVFEWERSGRKAYLVAAVAAMLVGLQFHTLAVFAAFLVFLPGMLQGDRRKFWSGAVAFVAIVAGFMAINTWISHAYPQSVEADSGAVVNGPHAALIPHVALRWLAAAAVPAFLIARWVVRGAAREVSAGGPEMWTIRLAWVLLACALLMQLTLRSHLAALLAIAGLVIAQREVRLSGIRVMLFLAFGLAVAVAQAIYLHAHAAGTAQQIVGVILGWPSVWPFLSIAQNSPVAGVLAAGGMAWGLWRIAHRQAVPDFLLLLAMGVWLPLLMIGYLRWNIPPRYAQAQIMPLLIGAFAVAQWTVQNLLERLPERGSPGSRGVSNLGTVAAAVACILIVNPARAARTVDSGYTNHPDHKGAAQFVAASHPGARDILIAEDVLQQTYYLGHVNYWLVNKEVAAPFMHEVAGRWLDFYTNTPLIGTGQDLERLIERADRGAIYIIGSGENWEDGRTLMRGFGISQALRSSQLRVVYRGRDGLTQVWKADAPQAAAAARRP